MVLLFPLCGPELSEIVETVQSCFPSRSVENKYFNDANSIIECVELLDGSAGSILHSDYDVWTCVDFCDKECILKNFVSKYETLRSA